MAFSDRAVTACNKAMENGTLSERNVRNVLRCKDADVQSLSRHIKSDNSLIRLAVVRIIGKLGDTEFLLKNAFKEKDERVLRELLSAVGERGCSDTLGNMISSEDPLVQEEAISMLRRAGKVNSLLPLLFDRDDLLVKRVKRYINEQNNKS